jgi:dihydroxyacid dehydratase/phosphogluconate dehydratase
MTREDLVKKLQATAEAMDSAADSLDFYGGSANAVMHAAELAGAAKMVAEWADELEKEEIK